MEECALEVFTIAVTFVVDAPYLPYKMFSSILVANNPGSQFTNSIFLTQPAQLQYLHIMTVHKNLTYTQ